MDRSRALPATFAVALALLILPAVLRAQEKEPTAPPTLETALDCLLGDSRAPACRTPAPPEDGREPRYGRWTGLWIRYDLDDPRRIYEERERLYAVRQAERLERIEDRTRSY